MARARVTHTKERVEGGKTTFQETSKVIVTPEHKPFAQLLFEDVGRLYSLQDSQIKLLIALVKHMDYQNVVRVSGKDRKDWAKEIGITPQTLNVAMSKLMDTGIVLRQSLGSYVIDPEIANKGVLSKIHEKSETFNANFDVIYIRTNHGVERKVKIRKPEHDPETGEVY